LAKLIILKYILLKIELEFSIISGLALLHSQA